MEGANTSLTSSGTHQQGSVDDVFAFPASFSQQRLWFLDALEPGSPVYNVPLALRFRGKLDVSLLAAAANAVVQRHEALRTGFHATQDGEILQIVMPSAQIEVPVVDVASGDGTPPEVEALRLAREEASTPFDLTRPPLFRLKLLRLEPEHYFLLFTVHHIVVDGWSIAVFYNELSQLYRRAQSGVDRSKLAEELPKPKLQFVDYALWKRDWVKTPACEEQLQFWKDVFAGGAPPLELPIDRPRPNVRKSEGAKASFAFAPPLRDAVFEVCRREKWTLFSFLLATFKLLLHRYSGQERITVGCPFANRARPELEASIGFYTTTIPIFTRIAGADMTFRELVQRVQDFSLEAQAHQDVPYERIVEAVNPTRDLSHNPLFQVMFAAQKSPEEALELGGLKPEVFILDNGTAKYDMLMEAQETARDVKGYIEYSTQIFQASTIERVVRNFLTLVAAAARNPGARLSELEWFDPADRKKVLETWNSTRVERKFDGGVPRLFETAARTHAQQLALVHGSQSLTYAALEERVAGLASRLAERGVRRGARVGLCCERSIDMITGVLGILRAGAAYVPLDIAYPPDRLSYMLNDAHAEIVVAQPSTASKIPRGAAKVLELDAKTFQQPSGRRTPEVSVTASDLAYVIYTSGSTGQPKGVAMPHGPLLNLIRWQHESASFAPGQPTLQFSSISFDVSFQEIFSTLTSGGTLVLIDESARRNPAELFKILREEKVERIFLPYIALQHLAEVVATSAAGDSVAGLRLREVMTAGEQLQVTPEIRALFQRLEGARLFNHYGPTESHVVTSYELGGPVEEWPALPPIGKPITNAKIYVLDSKLAPVPVGVPGELCIGGDVLADGYLNKPELTRDRFVEDPCAAGSGARIYRTGDVARFRENGSIDYIGRNDQQVKVRGFRVEPGEIETALRGLPGVRDAVVLPRGDSSAERRLEAFLISDPKAVLATAALRDALRKSLPEYMVPTVYYTVPKFPLTPSGKVDRKTLPAAAGLQRLGEVEKQVEPRDEIEKTLVEVWQSVLDRRPISVTSNFFDVGGTSILAVRIFAKLRRAFDVEMPLATLFEAPTVERLAAKIREKTSSSAASAADDFRCIVELQRGDENRPALFCVHGIGGNILIFHSLVRALGTDQTVYGIQARGVDGRHVAETTIEQMASVYVRELKELQPRGPYYLCGYSSGGLVALEMARILLTQGETIAFLGGLDSTHPQIFVGESPVAVSLYSLRNHGIWSFIQTWRRVVFRGYLRSRVKNKLVKLCLRTGRRLPQFLRSQYLALSFYEALKLYHPEPYAGDLVLFSAAVKSFHVDENLGWRKHVLGKIQVIDVPGSHHDLLRKEGVLELGTKLRAALDEVIHGASYGAGSTLVAAR
jgi:amino acid adenylation domain-containing protein